MLHALPSSKEGKGGWGHEFPLLPGTWDAQCLGELLWLCLWAEHTGDLGLISCPLFLISPAFSHLNFLPTCISAASAPSHRTEALGMVTYRADPCPWYYHIPVCLQVFQSGIFRNQMDVCSPPSQRMPKEPRDNREKDLPAHPTRPKQGRLGRTGRSKEKAGSNSKFPARKQVQKNQGNQSTGPV